MNKPGDGGKYGHKGQAKVDLGAALLAELTKQQGQKQPVRKEAKEEGEKQKCLPESTGKNGAAQ